MKIAALLGVSALMAAGLAHADTINLTWVPTTENPATAGKSIAHGTLTLNISPWTLTPITGNGFGPNYYTSGSAVTATVTAVALTIGDGQTITSLADLSSTLLPSQVWTTSAIDTPATGAQAPSAPTAGYYLTSLFTLLAHTDQGSTQAKIANNTGRPGTNLATGLGNGALQDGAIAGFAGTSSGGYWKVSPVPLPAGLPLLLAGLSAFGLFGASKRRTVGADL